MSRLRVLLVIAGCVVIAAVAALAVWPGDDPPSGEPEELTASAVAEELEAGEFEAGEADGEYEGEEGEEEEDESDGPEDLYMFERSIGGTATPSGRIQARAGRQAKRVRKVTRRRAPKVAAKQWTFRGPTNIGARVTDLVTDVSQPDTLWAATATGGVWVSRDAGSTFEYAWKDRLTQSIGAIAQAPDGTLYVGTGETNPGGGSLTFGGDGVYRSTDRGESWQRTGLEDSSTIGRLVIDPRDPDHILAAVSGDVFAPGGGRGLYETRDGGDTWARTLEPPNGTTGAADVAIDPKNPDNILVAMWDHIRYPDVRYYTGEGSGIWRSTDGGKTFNRLGVPNGLPPAIDGIGRIGVTFDPQDPSRAYAIYANNEVGAFQAFFSSTDGGEHWIAPPGNATLPASQSVYGWWFARVWVDPTDSDHIFLAGLNLHESTDGALTFLADGSQHADQHAMAWDPRVEGRVYSGNDGGVYTSVENGANDTWELADYMPWNQFFTIDVGETDPTRINGGVQDNGSVRSWGGDPAAPPEGAWDGYYGGDGVKNAINPENADIVFACSQYGACGRSENGGDDMSDMTNTSVRFGWLSPIEFQPGDANVMYWAGSEINRSDDAGASWASISPDLGKGELGREINPLYAAHYGTVQAVGIAPSDPDTIYAGTDNGYLWKTTDAGGSWTELTPNDDLPKSWATHITVDPADPDVVYLTYGGYHGGDKNPYVFRSRDGGKTWEDLSANLPQAPVQDLILVGDRAYVGTDVGVFTTRLGDRIRWLTLGGNLPNVAVNDLRYIAGNGTLYAGTFGRGIYSIPVG